MKPSGLRHADAVLGADRAAEGCNEAEHGLVDPLAPLPGAEEVHVHVAVSEVAEQRHPYSRGQLTDRLAHGLREGRHGRRGHAHVELARRAGGVDRVGDALPVGPQPRPVAGFDPDRDVVDVAERGGQLLGRVLAVGHLHEQVHGMVPPERCRQAGVLSDEGEGLGIDGTAWYHPRRLSIDSSQNPEISDDDAVAEDAPPVVPPRSCAGNTDDEPRGNSTSRTLSQSGTVSAFHAETVTKLRNTAFRLPIS